MSIRGFLDSIDLMSDPVSAPNSNSTEIKTSISADFLTELQNVSLLSIGSIIASVIFLICIYLELHFQYNRYFYRKCLREVVDAPQCEDASCEGKLVFLVGKLQFAHPYYLSDPVLPFFEITGSILLKRHVEMLQWSCTGKKSYEKKWSTIPVYNKNTKEFINPTWDPSLCNEILSEELDVYINSFKLCNEAIKLVSLNRSMKTVAPFEIEGSIKGYQVRVDSTYYYLTKNSCQEYEPSIGDYRIKYFYLELGTFVTVLGEYKQGKIERYKNKLLFADAGFVSINTIFERYQNDSDYRQNMVRALGLLGVIVGVIIASASIR